MTEKDFARIIKRKREAMKLTQKEVAKMCGIGDRTYQNVEYKLNENNEGFEISFSTYRKIAKVFNLKFTLQEKTKRKVKKRVRANAKA